MFAYVRFSDGNKRIVPTDDITKFDPKHYQQDVFYLVRWKNSDYKAQVLLVKGELYSAYVTVMLTVTRTIKPRLLIV